jgi:signal transduction histidine kinase/CheY-like chemotaxis protein
MITSGADAAAYADNLALLDDLPLAVFVVDTAGTPIYANVASVELLGNGLLETGPEAMSHLYGVYVAGSDTEYPMERLPVVRALAGETTWVNDIEIQHADRRVSLEVWGAPVRDSQGVIRFGMAAFTDITEAKRSRAELDAARHEAEKANHAKSEFLSRMSHELRTPLNAILGFAQLLEMDDLTREQRDDAQQIVKGGRRLLELIDEVLDISRVETGQLRMSLEPVRVGEVITDSVALIRTLAKDRSVRLVDDVAPATRELFVNGDRQRLGQVFLNLLSNAVKYNVDGGLVTVTSTEDSEGWIRICVSDTGPGVQPEKMPLLFTPYERLGAEQGNVEGTGLGLALSKGLVEAMGGELHARSVVGEGTTFTVVMKSVGSIQTTPLAELAGSASARFRMLYIEDNLSNLKLIERLLARWDQVDLLSAMTGGIGLDLAVQHLPDLILLDLHLPDMGGDEVLIRLRRDPRTSSIPIVILSADATTGEIRRLKAAGANQYLTKPLDISSFVDAIESALSIGGGLKRSS